VLPSFLFYRSLCVLYGLLGIGFFVLTAPRSGRYVYLGIACLLVGLSVTRNR
jgi:hypothetical protein